ncbi:MAG TPA: FkbM family methyltransferase [Granulicella sp.]
MIGARSLARKTGVIRLVNQLRRNRPYEERFHEALIHAIQPGDVVWDVGANVGLYTEQFCQWVGERGFVVAFEPSPESSGKILQRLPGCPWLRVENIALSDTDTVMRLALFAESVNNQLQTGGAGDDTNTIPVTVERGDTVHKRLERTPNAIKVDVEGFEEEVLLGMDHLLTAPELRTVLVEVHFTKLEQRGRATAPVRIERLLRSRNFVTKWVDPSHLVASRRSA